MPTPSPPDLTEAQKTDLGRLWKAQTRQLVDVRPSAETLSSSPALEMQDHTYRFVVRLHAFFFALLKGNAILFDLFKETARREELTRDSSAQQQQTFVKEASRSCLHAYIKLALAPSTTDTPVTSTTTSSSSTVVRLVEGRHVIPVHYDEFLQELNHFELKGADATDDFIRQHSFGAFLYHMPQQALPCVGASLSLAMASLSRSTCSSTNNTPTTAPPSANSPTTPRTLLDRFLDGTQFVARFHHLQPQMRMMDVRTGTAYKLVCIQGNVVKARPKRLQVVTADFTCGKCGSFITHSFDQGRYSVPPKCTTQKCRSKQFSLVRPSARYINAQELRLQESQEESMAHAGRTPRQMEVQLTHDLVDTCRPGDAIKVACIVQAVNSAVAEGKTGKRALETSTYKLYLEAHSIVTLSESSSNSSKAASNKEKQQQSSQPGSSSAVVYTQQQLESITQLAHADHRYFGMMERRAFPFDLLVRSLCPSIIGHDMVKAGLLLCLLGGTPPESSSTKGDNSIRCNSHILIVGDPGMGKSQMLLAATQIAARSVFVGGNTASTTGLTVSLTKEAGGETGIEAGALVLADRGICCLDEFDKMAKKNQDGLLEAMEQQQISIAKAGVVASLPARCSVIAAANPKHGSYNMSKTVAENLNMATPILSRFDLVFILRDRADKDQDKLVSSNIMNLYRSGGVTAAGRETSQSTSTKQPPITFNGDGTPNENRMSLKDRLAWVADFQKRPLPAELVRDYVSYAREYCKPKLTPEAAAVLKDYFMNLRYPTDGGNRQDTVPITTRQLEALIRLSQARAKACLREYVLEEDALDVVELMTQSSEQVHADESGRLDPSRGGAGGKSNRKMKKAFLNELYRMVGAGSECTLDDLRRISDKVNCGLHEFPTLVESMRNDGILMKTSSGNFKVLA